MNPIHPISRLPAILAKFGYTPRKSQPTIRRYAREGKFPVVKLDFYYYFNEKNIDKIAKVLAYPKVT